VQNPLLWKKHRSSYPQVAIQISCKGALVRLKKPDSSWFVEAPHCQAASLVAMHESMEAFSMQLFEDISLCAIHAKRLSVISEGMQLVLWIRG
jgi:histone H3/H4